MDNALADTMLAAVYYGPLDLRVEERPIPMIKPEEALLKVAASGICGTDLRIFHGNHRKYPPGTIRIPGHEVVGEIVAVGKDAKGIRIGQRVFVAPNMGCGRCWQCVGGHNNLCADYDAFGITIDGSFAEYMRIPSQAIQQGNLIPLEAEIDSSVGALIEPFACVLRGQDAVGIHPGDSVLVMGAGPIGLMHVVLAKLRGAAKVIVSEVLPNRVGQAKMVGVDRVVNPIEENLSAVVFDETKGRGVDVVIVAAASRQAQEIALDLAAVGGRINFFGGLPKDDSVISINSNVVHYKELILTGTTGCSTSDCQRAASIVVSQRIDLSPLISAEYPLSEALQAMQAAESRENLKVIILPRLEK
jgi:L-iditol 2-dehydrogenase